ncbi:PAS domain-containing sensor histidine kinase [Oryzicola mucosus]|uniref:PAS domain-containing sensor histidine kinase n=1 Tax=Oryzicola mucosus TaxID=2767425 RepID=UPI001E4A22B3|nr:PAS domain-containing sensor histidine kinase [Oryzicola mucosus]
MSVAVTRYGEFSGALAGGCDHLVHPSIVDSEERATHARLIGVLLAMPFLLAGPAVLLLSGQVGTVAILAVIFSAFGLCWLNALLVAATGRVKAFGAVGLALAAVWLTAVTFFAGAAASPLALLVLALPFEAWWVFRRRDALLAGGAAALLVFAAQLAVPLLAAAVPGVPAAWHWLVPAVWAGSVAARMRGGVSQHFRDAGVEEPSIPESALDAVVVRLVRSGEVISVSSRAETMLGIDPEMLTGSALFDRIHIADRIAYLCALSELREGAEHRSLEVRLRLPSDVLDGGRHSFTPFMMDIADDKRSDGLVMLLRRNEELAELRSALAKAHEAVAAGEAAQTYFLATVSHELRTPLNAIIGFSDMLLHDMLGSFRDPRQKEYVQLVHDSGQHLLSVVNAILDVAKIEAGCYVAHPEPFRFHEAVEMCASMMHLQAKIKNIDLAADVSAGTGEINADRRAVQQMLINLVSNAIKFTPEGGKVAIGAKRVGSRLHFWVNDNGIGIAEQDIATLGKPFSQIQNDYTRRFEGTGLGLSLVKGLVALHEGTMSIESAPGEGTKVTISLPVGGPKISPDSGDDAPVAVPMRKVQEVGNGSLRKAS